MWNEKAPILVIEDNSDDAFFLQRAFKKAEVKNPVCALSDGAEALDYLQGAGAYADRVKFPSPVLIVSDLKMPLVNGFEFLQLLKNDPKCAKIPVVVLTGSGLSIDVAHAYDLRANCYLQKPSNAEELGEMIRKLIEFWRMCELPY